MKHSPFDMGLSAAEVIARRMPVIWWGMVNPTAASQAEMTRMVIEKQLAFAEACVAMQVEMFRLMLAPWRPASSGRLVQAVLAPAARRVRANKRRLRR
ncbi:hypothetical protein [Aestuariivirga sp.]|jgi:hypothetical protein|uniref:hypothetical protein n=1 Tax=Aestuariivirga sp. TaxID=2650926 RepID=UPI00378446E1